MNASAFGVLLLLGFALLLPPGSPSGQVTAPLGNSGTESDCGSLHEGVAICYLATQTAVSANPANPATITIAPSYGSGIPFVGAYAATRPDMFAPYRRAPARRR